MYAVIKTGGKQYQVEEGDTLRIELLQDQEVGGTVTFEEVLFIGGETSIPGTPEVSGASVQGTLLREAKDRKIIVYKKKRRKGYQRLRGHRQLFMEVKIDKIVLPKGSSGS